MSDPGLSAVKSSPRVDELDRAVEVVGMLGESVVAIEHLSPRPPAPSARRAPRILFAAGAALLAVAAFAFAVGLHRAAADERALHHHVEVLHRPVYEFRPERLGLAYDALALGGLSLGVLAIGLGLLRKRAGARTEFAIGTAAGVDVASERVPCERFPLVQASDRGPIVRVAEGMAAHIEATDGALTPLTDLVDRGDAMLSTEDGGGYELAVPERGRIRIETGLSRFFVRWVPTPRSHGAMLLAQLEGRAAAFLGASALAHLLLLALIWNIAPDAKQLATDTEFGVDRFVLVTSKPNETPRQEEPPKTDGRDGGELAKGEVPGPASATGNQGTHGTPEETATTGKVAVKQRAERPQLARSADEARHIAEQSGFLGYYRRHQQFESLDSAADFASGYEDRDVMGGYDGDRIAAVNGTLSGQWGNKFGDFSNSPYYRDGVRTLAGYDFGDRRGDWSGTSRIPGRGPRDRKPRSPVVFGKTIVDDPGIDRQIIRQYIRRQLRRIEHCYERQLIESPNLAGTLTSTFTISANGTVQAARSTGMNSDGLGSCVSNVIGSIAFPATKNGSPVRVTYPFHFHAQ